METLSIHILGMIGATAACVIGVFYVCAACIRDETNLHDIKVEARKMRIEFDRRVSARNIGSHAMTGDTNDDDEEPFMVV